MESKPKQQRRDRATTSRRNRLAKVASKETDGRNAGSRDEDEFPETILQTSGDVSAVQDTVDHHDRGDSTAENSDSRDAESSRKRGRGSRSSRRRRPPITTLVLDSDAESVVEEDEGTARKSKRKSATKSPGRGPEETRTCPHCQKVCSTKYGLKYHLGRSKSEPAL